jgi:hypothetical protein
VVSEPFFGFRGTPLLLRIWLGLDRSILSWVCDKPGFSGRFCSGDSSVERGMARYSRIDIENLNMEDLLVYKEQWISLDPGTQPTGRQSTGTQSTGTQTTSTQPTSMSKEDWEKLDRRTMSTI